MRGKKKNAASNHLFAVTGLAFLVLLFSVICFLEDLTFLSTSAFTRTYLSIFIYFHRDISFYLQYIYLYGVPVHLYICFHRELPFYVNLLSQGTTFLCKSAFTETIHWTLDMPFYQHMLSQGPYFLPTVYLLLQGSCLSSCICFSRNQPFHLHLL